MANNSFCETTFSGVTRVSVLFVIRVYQRLISPLIGNNCRYYPCCSNYACCAIERHGCINGGFLIVRRILRCNPFSAGGFDPVPELPNPLQKQNQ